MALIFDEEDVLSHTKVAGIVTEAVKQGNLSRPTTRYSYAVQVDSDYTRVGIPPTAEDSQLDLSDDELYVQQYFAKRDALVTHYNVSRMENTTVWL